jgi:hypothetical protein
MAFLTAFYPDCSIRKRLDMRFIHKFLALSSFAFTSASIVTGIMDHMGRSGCNYISVTITSVEKNPAVNYDSIAGACKVANGLGMSVMLSSIVAIVAVSLRKSLVLPPPPTPAVGVPGNQAIRASGGNTTAEQNQIIPVVGVVVGGSAVDDYIAGKCA